MEEAVNDVSQHQQAEIQAEDRDPQYRQILDPPVTKGMRPVRGLSRQSGRNDRDQRIQTVRQVVDGVRLDRDGFDLLSGDVFRRKHQELYDQDHSAGTDDLAVADFFRKCIHLAFRSLQNYSIFRKSMNPVTSRTSLTISLIFRIVFLPFSSSSAFWIFRSRRSPADEI